MYAEVYSLLLWCLQSRDSALYEDCAISFGQLSLIHWFLLYAVFLQSQFGRTVSALICYSSIFWLKTRFAKDPLRHIHENLGNGTSCLCSSLSSPVPLLRRVGKLPIPVTCLCLLRAHAPVVWTFLICQPLENKRFWSS